MKRIRYCSDCKIYTLMEKCAKCGKDTIINSPTRYSRDELITKYRREIKRNTLKEKGLYG